MGQLKEAVETASARLLGELQHKLYEKQATDDILFFLSKFRIGIH